MVERQGNSPGCCTEKEGRQGTPEDVTVTRTGSGGGKVKEDAAGVRGFSPESLMNISGVRPSLRIEFTARSAVGNDDRRERPEASVETGRFMSRGTISIHPWLEGSVTEGA